MSINLEKRIELQEEGSKKIIQSGFNGIFEVCPRFGKTKTVIDSLRFFSGEVYISSPYTDIKENWLVEKEKWNYRRNFNVLCHRSLDKIPMNVPLLIIDEAQALSVNNLQTIFKKKPKKILLLSGYLGEESRRYIGTWLNNPSTIVKYTIQQGIDDKIISDFNIHIICVSLNDKVRYYSKKKYTERFAYDIYTEKFEEIRDLSRERSGYNELKMELARKRRELLYLSGTKLQAAKRLMEIIKDRKIIFTPVTDTANALSPYTYHSKTPKIRKGQKDNLAKFQDGDINELAVCNMVSMGITLPDLKKAIIHQVVSNSEMNIQRMLRICNIDNDDRVGDVFILCYKNTVDEEWVTSSLEGIPEDKINWYRESTDIKEMLKRFS